MKSTDSQKTSSFWSQHESVSGDPNFYLSPITRPYIIESAFGPNYVPEYRDNPFFAEDFFLSNHLSGKKIENVLSLCCGFGVVERRFAERLPSMKSCLGVDLAQGALEIAQQRAGEMGLRQISYQCADLNDYNWPEDQYDLVVANGALHHLRNLEGACAGIHRALRRGGQLIATEYVGPAYQDHSPRQLELINAAAYLVPPELRAREPILLPFQESSPVRALARALAAAKKQENPNWSRGKKLVARVLRFALRPRSDRFVFGPLHVSPRKYFLKVDPSEGVRSDEILPVLKSVFGEVTVLPMGGGLLQHALDENFYLEYALDNPRHVHAFAAICDLERKLMASGEIGIENAFILGEKA